MRQSLPQGPDLPSIQPLPSAAFATAYRLTTQLTWSSAYASMKVCAWLGCRRSDVGDGSIASVWPIAGYFRSSQNNGHGEPARQVRKVPHPDSCTAATIRLVLY